MSLISAHGIKKKYGPKPVLDGVSLTIEPGDRMGLIGVNGAGKSTLLRIMLGEEEADEGEVQRKRGLTTACVTQFPRLDPAATVIENVRRGQARHASVRMELEAIGRELEATTDAAKLESLITQQAERNELLEQLGGWNVEHEADSVMLALGAPPHERIVGTLSLGEQRRVALSAGILAHPELLVLDEPTNHIDVDAIEWLEDYLLRWPGSLILVTHDRYFLDRVANRHAEIDRGDLRIYEGNYTDYLAMKAERDAMEEKSLHKRARAIESELAWVRRGAPARTTKQKARLERYDALVAARPKGALGEASFRLPHPARLGKSILEIKSLSKSLGGKKLIENFDMIMKRGDRIGIVGPNGAGKTTLLRMIKGEMEPDKGTVTLGQNTAIAYADQRRILDEDNSVLEEVAGDSDVVYIGEESITVHGFLDGLLFDSTTQRAKISSLSGGEKSRVALAKALRVTANLLILDEPTNDLDLPTLRVLEAALVDYPGCVLIVSHDRYFVERVATGILAFEGNGKLTLYEGGWEAHRAREKAAGLRVPAPKVKEEQPKAKVVEKPKTKKRSFAEQREFEGLENQIMEAEARVTATESELADPALMKRGAEMKTKLTLLETQKREVEKLYARWEELGARG